MSSRGKLSVLVLDLWCYIPYYDRYFCESLRQAEVEPQLVAVSYYLDPDYFRKHGLSNDPGIMDIVARLRLSNPIARRSLMLLECCLNMLALTLRIAFSRPDILHIQWIPLVQRFPFDFWFMKFVRRRGSKIVYTVHNVLPHDSGQRFVSIYQRIYSGVDALICHTEAAKLQLQSDFSVDPRRIWVIPHGPLFHDSPLPDVTAARARLGFSPKSCVILMQGMLKPYKGLDFLLDAWRVVHARGLNAELVIAGSAEKDFEKEIRARVASLGVQGSVRLDLRFIPDEELSAYYQASDILVYPYKSITASGALATGLAHGRAIVATDLPGFRQLLQHGKNVLFVKYGDVKDLANTLDRLIREPHERERLAAEAGATLRLQNGWSAIAAQTLRCYLTLLGRESENLARQQPERP
jgi:glycosyltransferase involved in cell wall biosynthesis